MSDTELLDKSKTGAVRRLEVFTGAGRRRSWTAEQKAQIVAESHAEGATVCEVARRHALTPQQLFAWRRKAALADGHNACGGAIAFAPVVVTAASQHSTQATSAIEVLIGVVRVRVPVGVDPPTLQVVLRAARTVS
jgi:transposase